MLIFMYFSLLRYIFIWDACGFYFTDVVCGFSPGREKFCHFLEIGACRVGVSISLCVGLPRGAVIGWPFISLEVFDWHGGRCCCAVFVGLHNLCLSSWVCHVGLLFWLSIHFGGVI